MPEFTIPAIEFAQRGNRLFLFSMPASQLEKLVRSRRNLSTDDQGQQRLLDQKRVGKIAEYVSDEKFTPIPNSIVVNFHSQVQFMSQGANGIGMLVFPDSEGYFGDILDGQHRLYGIVDQKSKYPDLPLSVTGVMLDNPKNAGKVFADINRLQVKASPVLIVSIRLAIGDLPDDEESASAIVQKLDEDDDSPLHGKIKMHQDREGTWITNDKAIKIILKMIQPRNDLARIIKHLSTEKAISLIKCYFLAVAETFPDAWGKNKDKEYRLTRPAGLEIICGIFDRVLRDVNALNAATGKFPSKEDFITVLTPIKDSRWDAEYFTQNGFTSAGGIIRYIDDLLMKFPIR